MTDLSELIEKLVLIMNTNRTRHKKPWEKVRRDRVEKLLPDLCFEDVEMVVETAVNRGRLTKCQKQCDDGLVSALTLTNYVYQECY